MKTLVDFPDLNADEIAHSERLIDKIINKMKGESITFAEYMQMVLYHPGLGYYAAGSTKIGSQGDFITSPEVSHLFGQCVAQWAAEKMENKGFKSLLEFGAGTGKLCRDIVQHFDQLQSQWSRYLILETSPDLIQRQQQYLKQELSNNQFNKINWISEVPKQYQGIILANEVLDAIPAHIVIKQESWHELGVAFENERFTWKEVKGDSTAANKMQEIETRLNVDLPLGYCTELNLQHEAWLNTLYLQIDKSDILLIDYGYFQQQYYHEDRKKGTLMCYFRHRSHSDPLVLPGLQDVTVSVDFTALAEAAEDSGFRVNEINTQTEFLLHNGLLALAEKESAQHPLTTAQAIKTLTLPAEMGEIFKVVSLSK